MENLVAMVEWTPVVVSAVAAFMLGWVWYSPMLFVKGWMEGLPMPAKWEAPMWMPMFAQAGATLFFAIVVNQLMLYGDIVMVSLITLTLMGFVKANGMYSGKTKWAISVEVLYILAMAAVLVGVNLVL